MTKLQWFFLWLLFVCYLFMGATFFYLIERHLEDQRKVEEAKEREEIYDLLEFHLMGDTPYSKKLILSRISDFCEKPIYKKTNETNEDEIPPEHYSWSYFNSFFFSLTTISTVGYGNIAPSSNKGRLLVIFYSLMGIPFTGIVLSQLGEFFGSVFLRAHHRYKNKVYESCFPLIMDIIVYLVPGLLIIIIVPALMFSHFEEWDLIMSIYYAYVTLTTIGFGDLVAGQREEKSIWYNYVYKTIIIIWVMFGLGYLVMVMGFIARGLRSKKVHKIEHKLASTIKQTRAKIWNEFVHDVNHVRRLLNEMYLLKVKRVYMDKEINVGLLGRSKSCPNFASWPTARLEDDGSGEEWSMEEEWDGKQVGRRRRAFSEHVTGLPRLQRGVSESHLDLIDKDATFDNQSIQTIQSKQIFAKAVDAAFSATSNQSFDTGVNCFSDEEILASERTFRRNRAMSYDVCRSRDRLSMGEEVYKRSSSDTYGYNHQNTWSGTDTVRPSILKNIRFSIDGRNSMMRDKEDMKPMETPHSSASSLRRMSTAAMNFFNINHLKKKMKSPSKPSDERETDGQAMNHKNIKWEINDKPMYLSDHFDADFFDKEARLPGARRGSIAEAFLVGAMERGNGSNKMSHVLEQTSVADFLRLLSTVETSRMDEDGKEKGLSTMSLFKETDMGSPKPDTNRRFSQAHVKHHQILPRTRRYSQFSDSLGSSAGSLVPQRRKFSHVPSLVGSLSSVAEDRRDSLHGNELVPPRNELKHRRRASKETVTPTVIITPPDKTHRFNVTSAQAPTKPTASGSKTSSEDSLDEIIIRL